MEIDGFWTMIERSGEAHEDKRERALWLEAKLAMLRGSAIVDFAILLDQTRRRADQWTMWGASKLILGGYCSSDSFFYFQPWLIGSGQEVFDRVVADPDELAEVPQVQRLAGLRMSDWGKANWPEWESLNYVAHYAYEYLLGPDVEVEDAVNARAYWCRSDPHPSGSNAVVLYPDTTARRLPKLAEMFRTGGGKS